MYKFDVDLTAKASMKERFVWMLYLGMMFFLLYGSANQYASLTAPHSVFFFEWEKNIPFIEAFIIPYMASDLMFVIAFLLPYTRLELRVLALRVLSIMTVSVFFFLLFPLQFSFEKPVIETFIFLFGLLEADLPFNQAPSLHVSFAIVLWFSMASQMKSLFFKVLLALWFGLIILSTLMVYQHHFIDIPTGALLGFLVVYFISEKRENRVLKAFMTPRSLKMALYYLVASIVFTLLAFNVSVLFIYIALSLFLVSVIYAFGLHQMLNKYFLVHLLLFPYYLGNYVSWRYYKRRLPLIVALKEGVYFGRFPAFEEYSEIKEQGISTTLNLAWEQPRIDKVNIFRKRLSFLDQTIPDPKLLDEAVAFIEKYKAEGLFVHCALGLSRSVLVVSAWLLYKGESRDEVKATIKELRPDYVKSSYMDIALDIYEDYLDGKKL